MTAFSDGEIIKLLTGNSGCTVQLCRRHDSYFVRKISPSEIYNARLTGQINKQISLGNILVVPRVLQHGIRDELVFFDMEYITGHDFGTYYIHQKVSAVYSLVESLVSVFHSLSDTQTGHIHEERFRAKIGNLMEAVRRHTFYGEHAAILDGILEHVAVADWSLIPRTECHGDLTLENVIFRPEGELVFIDLLDGDLESVWMDIAKLLHDLETGWSLRRVLWKQDLTHDARFLFMLSRYLAEELTERVKTDFPEMMGYIRQLRMLQAMRVLPYIRDKSVFARVVQGVDHLQRTEQVNS